MAKIQVIVIIINLLFLGYIARLIKRGKLREEYAIVWIVCTVVLIVFSVWRKGLDIMAKMFGVYEPANLVFTGFIFVILIYLLHLSIVNSKQQNSINKLTQEITLMKEKIKNKTLESNKPE